MLLGSYRAYVIRLRGTLFTSNVVLVLSDHLAAFLHLPGFSVLAPRKDNMRFGDQYNFLPKLSVVQVAKTITKRNVKQNNYYCWKHTYTVRRGPQMVPLRAPFEEGK